MRYLISSLLFLSGIANATSFYSTQSGNINDGATFGNTSPGVQGTDYPGTNDNFTIKPTITITAPYSYNVTIGSITFLDGGTAAAHTKLVISSSGTGLTISSTVLMGQTVGNSRNEVQLTSSAVLNLNGFNWVMGAGGTSRNYIELLGNSGGSVTVKGGGGSFTQGTQGGFDIMGATWNLVNFSSMGSVGLAYGTAGHNFIMSSCSWVSSGQLTIPQNQAVPADMQYVEYSDFRAPTTSPGIRWRASLANKFPTGRNDFTNNTVSTGATTLAGVIFEIDAPSVTVQSNIFRNWQVQDVGTFGLDSIIQNNVFITTQSLATSDVAIVFAGTTTINNNYFYSEGDNPHYLTGNGSTTITNNIFETNTQGAIVDDGDTVLYPTTGLNYGFTRNNLQLGTRSTSVLLSMQGGSANINYSSMTHNTIYFDQATTTSHYCFRVGETYTGRTGMFSNIRGNICMASASDASAHILGDVGGAAANKVSTGNYNASFNIAGTKYQGTTSNGFNDIVVNPNFIDITRKLTAWDTSLGGPGTSASAVSNLMQLNGYTGTISGVYDGAYNSAYSLSSLMTYVKTGFTPQAQVLKGAGDDGIDIGAYSVIPPTSFFMAGP